MTGVSLGSSFGDLAVYALDAGYCCIKRAAANASAGNKSYALVIGALGLGWGVMGALSAAVPFIAYKGNCEGGAAEGDSWMGHCYPWSQFPHGHFDCGHGGTEFEPYRSQDNERTRIHLFNEDSICIRGIGVLEKTFKDTIVSCLPNGTEILEPVLYGQLQDTHDLL